MRDVVLTRDELESLMAGLLVSAEPARGRDRLDDWLVANAATLGRSYQSELGGTSVASPDSASPDRALVLASTSPQRRAILEQLRIPFTVVEPVYVEHDPPDADPVALVRAHAEGKARSVHAAVAR